MTRLGIDGRELQRDGRTGIARYALEILTAASARGWTVTVYGDHDTRRDLALPGVTVRVLQAPATVWWDQVALPRALRADGARVLLSPYYKTPLWSPCPSVVTIHDLFFIGYPGRRRPVMDGLRTAAARLYAWRAHGVIADSEHSARAVVERLGIDRRRITVAPVAVGAEFVPSALDERARARYGVGGAYVLYVGNFMPHKNLHRLLRAWGLLPGALRARHRLVLAGGGDAGRAGLRALAAALGIADSVVFPGRVADGDLPGLYSAAAVFVLPSLEEGFGLPAVEAMACGAPVIVSDGGALPEVTAGAAVVFDAGKEEALAAAITAVLVDREHADVLRRRGAARARAFAPAHTTARVLDLLERVAHGHR
ncbi:MAG: glycosyltransferase family 1 protein [Candidatus Rokuibacteriota bacterium]